MKSFTAGLLVVFGIIGVRPAQAAQEWKLSVGFQNPAFARAEHGSEYTPQVTWNASLPNLGFKHLTLFSVGQYSTRNEVPFWSESKANVGLNYAVSRNLDVYTFWESRFQIGESRVVAGVRLNLGGKL